jgi:hypothetical protein
MDPPALDDPEVVEDAAGESPAPMDGNGVEPPPQAVRTTAIATPMARRAKTSLGLPGVVILETSAGRPTRLLLSSRYQLIGRSFDRFEPTWRVRTNANH